MIISGILAAIEGVAELFGIGQRVYETVTGKPSTASTTAELGAEVEAMTPEQQQAWAAQMEGAIAMYRAQTDRLRAEQGDVNAETLAAIPEAARAKVALLRMTTRPNTVRLAMHFILLPAYLAGVDVLQGLVAHWIVHPLGWTDFEIYGAFKAVFGVSASQLLTDGTILDASAFGSIYTTTVSWLVPIIVTYMTLREVGKARDAGTTVTGAVGKVVGAVRGLLK
ncbi:MAG: hypothetical protein VYB54_07435 [Pseudomonadota bacterium]|nr:hypothetical protein [Pseudomonadota bacterium]